MRFALVALLAFGCAEDDKSDPCAHACDVPPDRTCQNNVEVTYGPAVSCDVVDDQPVCHFMETQKACLASQCHTCYSTTYGGFCGDVDNPTCMPSLTDDTTSGPINR